tara:strand:- start:4307 stop:10606 length:6300 start_codon:yes stop_codon:yes gene_type:complete
MDWRYRNECQPFSDENGKLYIVVDSEWESIGTEKESRLAAAKVYGVEKLLQFYGKETTTSWINAIQSYAVVEDYFVSYKPCVPMKVLVRVLQATFDGVPDDASACDINKPAEGYLSAYLSAADYRESIEYVADTILSYVPKLAVAGEFITNIDIIAEANRLRRCSNVIDRYFTINQVTIGPRESVTCPPTMEDRLEIGYTYDYKVAFALVEGSQYTVGYDCFIENTLLNHLTTANYLINLSSMVEVLNNRNQETFDIFSFLSQYTLPTPVIQTKEKPSDGLPAYSDGASFGWADAAKLLSLELDINLCKSAKELAEEEGLLNLDREQAAIQAARRKLATKDRWFDKTRDLLESIKDPQPDQDEQWLKEALGKIFGDVLGKANIACIVNESLQCYLDRLIALLGEQILDEDCDLGNLLQVSIDLGEMVDSHCGFKRCDNRGNIFDFTVGFPIFQGLSIPANFPTIDFLDEAIAKAIEQLYRTLIGALASAIMGVIENSCDFLFDDVLGEGDAVSTLSDGYQSWISNTIGINISELEDPEAWKEALVTTGGSGFVGVIGGLVSSMVASGKAVWSATGVSLNLPNPDNGGRVEEVFISPQVFTSLFTDLLAATEAISAVTTASEQAKLYKGNASEETQRLAFRCIKLRNPDFAELIADQYKLADMFSAMGKLVDSKFLFEVEDDTRTPPRNFCDLDDGSEARAARETLLSEKDPDISEDDINEIIDKEIERNKEKLCSSVTFIESYLNGGIAPPFPTIFGGEDSLIPEMPEIIDAIAGDAGDGILATIISSFNFDAVKYGDIWEGMLSMGLHDHETVLNDPRIIWGRYRADTGCDDTLGSHYERKYFRYYTNNNGNSRFRCGYSAPSGWSPAYTGGEQSVLNQEFSDGDVDESDAVFSGRLQTELGMTYDVMKDIFNFLEDHDHKDGLAHQLFYEPDDTLVAYDVWIYHEGGVTRIGKDPFTEVTIVKSKYEELDQPPVGSYTYNFGGNWNNNDTSNFEAGMKQKDWFKEYADEVGQDASQGMLDALSGFADDDWDKIATAAGIALVGGTTPAAVMLLLGIIGGTSLLASGMGIFIGPLFAALFLNTFALAIGNAVIAGVFLAVWAWRKKKEERGREAWRFSPVAYTSSETVEDDDGNVVSLQIPDLTTTFDIVVNRDAGSVTVTKREILSEKVSRPGSWPRDLTRLDRPRSTLFGVESGSTAALFWNEETQSWVDSRLTDIQNNTRLRTYVQDYTIKTTEDDLGDKKDLGGLDELRSDTSTNDNDEPTFDLNDLLDVNALHATQSDGTAVITSPYANIFGRLVTNALKSVFTSSSDAMAIESMMDSFNTDPDAANQSSYYLGRASVFLDRYGTFMQQLLTSCAAAIPAAKYFKTPMVTNEDMGTTTSAFDSINLVFPDSDIFDFTELAKQMNDYIKELIKLEMSLTYCDSIGPNNRANVSYSIIMLVRLVIIEIALASVQVLEVMGPGLIDSPIFAKQVLELIKLDMEKWQASFDTLDSNLYDDILNNSKIYWETLFLINGEGVTYDSGEDALTAIIVQEIVNVKPSISTTLNLSHVPDNYDEFITSTMFPTVDAPAKPESGTIVVPPLATELAASTVSATYENELIMTHYYEEGSSGYHPDDGDGYDTDPNTGLSHSTDSRDWFVRGLRDQYDPLIPDDLVAHLLDQYNTWLDNNEGLPNASHKNIELERKYTYVSTTGDKIRFSIETKFTGKAHEENPAQSGQEGDPDASPPEPSIPDTPAAWGNDWTYKVTLGAEYTTEFFGRMSDWAIFNPFRDEVYGMVPTNADINDAGCDSNALGENGKRWGPPSRADVDVSHEVRPGLYFERYIKFQKKGAPSWRILGVSNFVTLMERALQIGSWKPFAHTGDGGIYDGAPLAKFGTLLDQFELIRFGFRLNYIDVLGYPGSGLSDIGSKARKWGAFYLKNQTIAVNSSIDEFLELEASDQAIYATMPDTWKKDFNSVPLINVECEYTSDRTDALREDGSPVNKLLNEIFEAGAFAIKYEESLQGLKESMWERETWRILFDLVVPVKDIAATLAVYQYSALSDEATFIGGVQGTNLYQIVAKSKLSALQIIVNSIYGTGKVSFVDPFLQKAGTP